MLVAGEYDEPQVEAGEHRPRDHTDWGGTAGVGAFVQTFGSAQFVNWQPLLQKFWISQSLVVVRVDVAQEVPA